MSENTSQVRYLNPPPEFDGTEGGYKEWLPLIAMWLKMTTLTPSKQAMTIILSLKDRARSVASNVIIDHLERGELIPGVDAGLGSGRFPEGVVILINALNEAGFRPSSHMMSFTALEDFMNIHGRSFQSMKEYTAAFTARFSKAEANSGLKLDEPCTAMMMLLKSGLPKEEFSRVMSQAGPATELTPAKMKSALHWLFPTVDLTNLSRDSTEKLNEESGFFASSEGEILEILEETTTEAGEEVFLSRQITVQNRYRPRNSSISRPDMQRIQCYNCRQFGHYQRNCPSSRNSSRTINGDG